METHLEELKRYKNFDELANDVFDLAKQILPEQLFYLSVFSTTQQFILKLSNERTNIHITEGMVVDLDQSVCKRIDFENNKALVYEDIDKDCSIDEVKTLLNGVNIQSYLGIPISLTDGKKFGTLCAVNDEASILDERSIAVLQRIVKLFSYYLELERFAWKDMLTDLYNRRYLTTYFEDHQIQNGAIFFLDLDGFKKVNDGYGHDAGDVVLKEVASRLKSIVDEQTAAFAVRLGGDEFILHFSQCSTKEEWSEIAHRIVNALNTWTTPYKVSTSIGIVTYEKGEVECLNTLLQHADAALYDAKSAGKNMFKFYE
ncbi:MAG: sensor domain-containing diguanylate cyclase [Exiguobacterium indicum]